MRPKITGTRTTSNCSDIAPRSKEQVRRPVLRLVGRFLVSTRSYKFGLFVAGFLFIFSGLLLRDAGKPRLEDVGQAGVVARRERAYQVRRDDHQQLFGRLVGGAAAEQLPQNRNIA